MSCLFFDLLNYICEHISIVLSNVYSVYSHNVRNLVDFSLFLDIGIPGTSMKVDKGLVEAGNSSIEDI